MATTPTSTPPQKQNRIGLTVIEYKGGKTTLCAGCGHNAISERIIDAMFEMGVKPERVAKLSGIGCSSKSPAYFMSRSHSFNAVHGRMPSVATGAMLANRTLMALGVSGDGDTASIGVGQFGHLMRRNLPTIYIIEDHEGSTKSYKYMKDHEEPLQDINFIPAFEEIDVEYDPGATVEVTMHDGSRLRLRKLEEDYDPTDKINAIKRLGEAHQNDEVLTGVFYVNTQAPSFIEMLNMTEHPLATLSESVVRPGREVLDAVMEELR